MSARSPSHSSRRLLGQGMSSDKPEGQYPGLQLAATASDRPLTAEEFKLRSIDLYVTAACNRRCSYCFLTDDFLASRLHMSPKNASRIAYWAKQGSIDELTLLGGEPALNPDFRTIAVIISDL